MGLLQGKTSTGLNVCFSGCNYTRRYVISVKLICCFGVGDGHKQTFNIKNTLLPRKLISVICTVVHIKTSFRCMQPWKGEGLWLWTRQTKGGKLQLRSSFFCLVTQRIVAYHYPRFTKTYRSHIQGSSWISWPLKMGPIGFPETSVRNYHYTLRKTPQKPRFHPLCDRSLKSRNFNWFHRTEFLISPCS
jgi:hypothetical protein